MKRGLIEYFGASHRWAASLECDEKNKFGDYMVIGYGTCPDSAVLSCLKDAEDMNGFTGGACFEIAKS